VGPAATPHLCALVFFYNGYFSRCEPVVVQQKGVPRLHGFLCPVFGCERWSPSVLYCGAAASKTLPTDSRMYRSIGFSMALAIASVSLAWSRGGCPVISQSPLATRSLG
jgi:hypothetical protein